MNILIVGEFSGFSKNLKVGLNELGHKVSIMSTGDNFKKIKIDESDINILKYYTKRLNNKYLNFIFRIIIVYLNRVRLKLFLKKNYDIIFLLNAGFIVPGIFSIKAGLPLKWLKKFIIKYFTFRLVLYIISNVNSKSFTTYTAHHFPPYHIEAAQTPVCVVSNFLRFYKNLILFCELNFSYDCRFSAFKIKFIDKSSRMICSRAFYYKLLQR